MFVEVLSTFYLKGKIFTAKVIELSFRASTVFIVGYAMRLRFVGLI